MIEMIETQAETSWLGHSENAATVRVWSDDNVAGPRQINVTFARTGFNASAYLKPAAAREMAQALLNAADALEG